MITPIQSAEPIHTGTINGIAVRFFRGAGSEPDMPWHAHEDLMAALALARTLRRALRAAILRHQTESCRTVEVEGEPVLIAPHFVAQGLIGMAQEVGRDVTTTADLVEREYHRAGVAAMKALTNSMTAVESFEFAMRAFHAQGGAS